MDAIQNMTIRIHVLKSEWLALGRVLRDARLYVKCCTEADASDPASGVLKDIDRVLTYFGPYVKMKEIMVGDRLRADNGFTCLAEDQICEVKLDGHGTGIR